MECAPNLDADQSFHLNYVNHNLLSQPMGGLLVDWNSQYLLCWERSFCWLNVMTGNGGRWWISVIGGLRQLVGGVNVVLLFDGFLGVFVCEVPTGSGRS